MRQRRKRIFLREFIRFLNLSKKVFISPDFHWFKKKYFEIPWFLLRLVTLILPIWVIATDTFDWYLHYIHGRTLYLHLFRYQILSYCQSIERRRRELKSTLWKYYVKILDNNMNSTKKITFAKLAKVFRFTFAKCLLPSPLAKCEGLCAYLYCTL